MLVQKDRLRSCLLMVGALAGLLAAPAVSHGAYVITFGSTSSPELQGVTFAPPTVGTTVTGSTTGVPSFDVSVSSLEGITLRGAGQSVTNNTSNAGFRAVAIAPEAGIQLTYLDFQLDSLINTVPVGSTGLTITVFQGATLVASSALAFPWQGTQADNQSYMVFATGSDWFNRVEIRYTPPAGAANNSIEAVERINVSTTIRLTVVPAPPSATLAGAGLLTLGLFGLRRSWKRKAAV